MKKRITLFGGSRMPSDLDIIQAAQNLGAAIGSEGYDLYYGGGISGVMGKCARSAQKNGAGLTVVTTESFKGEEQFADSSVLVAQTDYDRFELMAINPSPVAICVLPGGVSTLREAWQAIELSVYRNDIPVILVDDTPHLRGIKRGFHDAIQAHLIPPEKLDNLRSWRTGHSLTSVLEGRAIG